jgi:hypothetical protein
MGIVTTMTETAFTQSAEQLYNYVTNPENWTKSYPGSEHMSGLHDLPLKVGDTWMEQGPAGEHYSWQLATAVPNRLWVCNTTGRLGHDGKGNGGFEGRIMVRYEFSQPGGERTLFTRTMLVDTYRGHPLPDSVFASMNPTEAEKYHAAIAKALGS